MSGTISLEKAERRIAHVNRSMQMKFKFASALSVVSQERITPTEATEGPYLGRFPEIAIA